MGRWGVSILLAVFGSSAMATYSKNVTPGPIGIGTFNVQIRNFNASTTYERDTRVGDYSQTHLVVSSLHSIQTTAGDLTKSSPEPRPDSLDMGPDQLVRLQVFRKGNVSELQWYILTPDEENKRLIPSIERRTINLVTGSWQEFEKGEEVTAEVIDEQDYLDSIKIFSALAEMYYNAVYLPIIKKTTYRADAPVISIDRSKKTKVLLSSSRIVVMQQVDEVRIKTNIFPPNK